MSLGQREWKVGRHLIGFEPPDILRSRCREVISLADAVQMAALSREIGAIRPFFMLVDLTQAGLPDPEASRYFSEHLCFERILGILYLGTRLIHRAAAKGMLLAAHLTEQTTDASVLRKAHFISSEQEALALIARLRADAAGGAAVGFQG